MKAKESLLAIGSGLLTALAFPKFSFSFFGWISLIPLLYIILKKTPKQSFYYGLLAGISYNALLIYWIPCVPAHYGNLSIGLSLVIYIIFVLFLSLFWALFSFLCSKIAISFQKSIFFLVPFLWISFEYILTYLLTGFPWGLLGYSQYKNIYLIQLASITGVYGISFVLVFFQSMFLFSIIHRKRSPFFIALMLIGTIHIGGFIYLKQHTPVDKHFSASVIQGNVSSDIYWDRIPIEKTRDIFDQHLSLTQQAIYRGARLIIWPEFSVPLCFSCPYGIYQEFKDSLYQFVLQTHSTLLIGTNEKEMSPEGVRYYNTALCLTPSLSITTYYKMHLVPFGEYTPYKKVFSFIEKVTHAIGDITPGTRYTLHDFDGNLFASPICYEIIFPNLVRKFVKNGASFLVTITNDGWYGRSSAPYQHFAIAVFRSVENRRYLLRAATTGISAIIDPHGRILSQTKLETQAFLTGDISPIKSMTFYTKYGDIISFIGLTLSAIFFILSLKRKTNGWKKHKRDIFRPSV